MPRIPGEESLGGPNIPRGTRPIITGADTGAGMVGRGMEKVGATIAAIGEEERQKEDALELIKADNAFKSSLAETRRSFETDPDYKTYGPRFDERTAPLAEQAASQIRNPNTRAKWMERAKGDLIGARESVLHHGLSLQREHKEIELEGEFSKRQGDYAATRDPAQRAAILRDMQEKAQLAEQTGLVRPKKAAHLRDKFIDGTIELDINERAYDDPEGVLRDFGVIPGGKKAAAGKDVRSVLTSGQSRGKPAGWAASDPTWQKLNPFEKAAAMALLEADGARVDDARNALGAIINRAAKEGEDLGSHVSRSIYQPTIEPAQQKRLATVIASPAFKDLTAWGERRSAGKEADPVKGATHFLAPEKTMLELEKSDPSKYRNWGPRGQNWTGYDPATGQYKGVTMRDGSHAFLAPEGPGPIGDGAPDEVDPAPDVLPYGDPDEPSGDPESAAAAQYRMLSGRRRQVMINKARVALSAKYQRSMASEIARLNDGQEEERDERGETLFDRAERILQPNVLAQWRIKREQALVTRDATAPLHNLTEDQAREHIRKTTRERPGVEYATTAHAREVAEKHLDGILQERKSNPAAAVDGHPLVVAALRAATPPDQWVSITSKEINPKGGSPSIPEITTGDIDPQQRRAIGESIVDARLKAQTALGIAKSRQRTITKREAEQLLDMGDPAKLDSEQQTEQLAAAAGRIKEAYGPEIGERVFNDALVLAFNPNADNLRQYRNRVDTFDTKGSEQRAKLLAKSFFGHPIRPSDIKDLQHQEAWLARIGSTSDIMTPNAGYSDAAPMIGQQYQGPKAQTEPTDRQVKALKEALSSRPNSTDRWLDEFDQRFGQGAAYRALKRRQVEETPGR